MCAMRCACLEPSQHTLPSTATQQGCVQGLKLVGWSGRAFGRVVMLHEAMPNVSALQLPSATVP